MPSISQMCSAKTKRGTRCQARPVAGSSLCALHANPDRAAELGRIGGRKNRHYFETDDIDVIPPSTPEEVKNLLSQAMADVRAKKLTPGIAGTLTYMASVLLKAMDDTDTHRRLSRLEGKLKESEDQG